MKHEKQKSQESPPSHDRLDPLSSIIVPSLPTSVSLLSIVMLFLKAMQ